MAKSSKSKASKKAAPAKRAPVKTRGTWLTVALVVIVVHGLAAFIFFTLARLDATYLNKTWALSLMGVHSLANLVAAVGIWYWQKWGPYLYAASAVLALVVGLVTVGAWAAFYMVLPVAILGWLLRTKWDYFKIP
jgi:hypothetical protein